MKVRNQMSHRQMRLRELFQRKQHIERQVANHGDPLQALSSDATLSDEYREILQELAKLL